jgi:hypothetical protein
MDSELVPEKENVPESFDQETGLVENQSPVSVLTIADVPVLMTVIDEVGFEHWPGVNGSFASVMTAERVTLLVTVGERYMWAFDTVSDPAPHSEGQAVTNARIAALMNFMSGNFNDLSGSEGAGG